MHLSLKHNTIVLFSMGVIFLCSRNEVNGLNQSNSSITEFIQSILASGEKSENDRPNTMDPSSSTTELTSSALTTSSVNDTTISDSTTESSIITIGSTESTTGTVMTTTGQADSMLKIHFISDLKYNIVPIDSKMDLCQLTSGEIAEDCFGGLVRLASYMSERISETDIWVNAGNSLQGKLFKLLKFDAIVEATKKLMFDAVAADREMFQYGVQAAENIYMEGLKDVLVSLNYKEDAPTKQIQKNRCNIAIIGFVDKESTDAMGIPDLVVSDEMEYIQKQLQSLQNIITVVVGSSSKAKAEEIANIEGVNLVIFSGADASDFSSDHCWEEIIKDNGENAYITSLKYDDTKAEFLFRVGEISLELTEECTISNITFEAVEDYSQLNTSDTLQGMTVAILENLQTTIVNTSIPLTGEGEVCQLAECFLGNLMTDAIMTAVSEEEAKAATENPVRFSVFPTWTLNTNVTLTGEIKTTDLYELFEDDSYLYSITMSVQQIKEMLEESVSDYQSAITPMKNFLQVSNFFRATYYLENNKGERVHEIRVFDTTDNKFHTLDLSDDGRSFSIAVPEFLLRGAQFSFVNSENLNAKFLELTVLDSLKNYISWKGSLQGVPLPVIPTVGERTLFSEETKLKEKTCYNNTGEVVIITIVVIAVIMGGVFAVWKFVYPRFRMRRGSRIALIT